LTSYLFLIQGEFWKSAFVCRQLKIFMKYEKKQKLQGNIQTYPIFVIFVYDVINKLLYV